MSRGWPNQGVGSLDRVTHLEKIVTTEKNASFEYNSEFRKRGAGCKQKPEVAMLETLQDLLMAKLVFYVGHLS